jgi:hypothetical protein
MNAVGRDQQPAFMAAGGGAGGPVDEIGANAFRCLRPAGKMMAGKNALLAEPVDRGIEQDLMQRAAVDRELRPFITGVQPARLAPDRFAVLGEISKFSGAHAERVKLIQQTQLDQFAHRMRQHVDADAERLQRGDAFEYFGRHADLMQAERQRQPADAAAGDENGHGASPGDVIPGRALRANPESSPMHGVWIPGLRARARIPE